MPLRRTVTLLLAAIAVVTSLAAPAGVASAAPTTPSFPRTIDAYARYETESGCDPSAKPGALEVQRILRGTYGNIAMNTPRACSSANSGHEEGRAVDWMTNVRNPGQAAVANDFIAWLLAPDQYGNTHAMARRLGVSYLIWDSRKFYLWNTSAGWTEYSDCLTVRRDPAYDNTCHRNHVHISLSWAGAQAQTSWYTAQGQWRTTCPAVAEQTGYPLPPPGPVGFVGVAPYRVLDTRGAYVFPEGCRLAPGGRADLSVLGRGGVPTSGVSAVVLNVTAVGAAGPTWVAAYPTGTRWPGTSSVNTGGSTATAASVVVPVGRNGQVTLLNGINLVDVVVDVVGFYTWDGSGARFTQATPHRALDAVLGYGTFSTVGSSAPAGTTAVVANVTIEHPQVPNFVSVVPVAGGAVPSTSSVNATWGETSANRVFSRSDGASVGLFSSAPSRTIVDVTGWFGPSGTAFTPVTPTRVADSRSGTGVAPLTGGRAAVVQLTGAGGVPPGARTVAVTLTGVDSTGRSHLTVWQPDTPRPATSDLNLAPGAARSNLVLAPVDAQGRVAIELSEGAANVVVDVLGYFT